MPSAATTPPLFVGGVPRSGTHALANLIGRHSRYAMVPRELGFHTGVGGDGLPQLLDGRIALPEFLQAMSGHWWRRTAPWDRSITRGLYKTFPEDRFRECLEDFERAYPGDRLGASRRLMAGLLDPIAREAGKTAWIEMDPHNMLVAPLLHRLFPDMRFIQITRDGRDVAMSLANLPWGSQGVTRSIWAWQRGMRDGHEQLRALPTASVLTVQLEDLVANRREETYARVLDFLALEDEPEMQAFFDEQISAQNAHLGRWRASLSSPRRLTATAVYACALGRLAAAGVSPRPSLRSPRAHAGATDYARRPQPETIDPWADGRARDA
jgi:hypothetical protein